MYYVHCLKLFTSNRGYNLTCPLIIKSQIYSNDSVTLNLRCAVCLDITPSNFCICVILLHYGRYSDLKLILAFNDIPRCWLCSLLCSYSMLYRYKLSNGNSNTAAMKGETMEWNGGSHFSFFAAYAENNGSNNMHYKKVHSDFTDTTVITTLSVVIKEDYYYCYGSVCKDTSKLTKWTGSKVQIKAVRNPGNNNRG